MMMRSRPTLLLQLGDGARREEVETPDTEFNYRARAVGKLTEGLGLVGTVIKVLQDADSNVQRASSN